MFRHEEAADNTEALPEKSRQPKRHKECTYFLVPEPLLLNLIVAMQFFVFTWKLFLSALGRTPQLGRPHAPDRASPCNSDHDSAVPVMCKTDQGEIISSE